MEETKINGIYAVKVGKLWARNNYSEVELFPTPKSLVGFKEAIELAEKTGGTIYQFTPEALDEEQIATLKLAAEAANESV